MLGSKIGTRAAVMALCAFVLASCLGLVGCGGSDAPMYKDGTYTGKSSVLDANVDGDGYAEVTVTVEGGAIVDASCEAFQVDGTPKDSSYGQGGGYYGVAQKVVSSIPDYEQALVDAGTPDGVDVISGATYLHDQFVEAVEDALSKAE